MFTQYLIETINQMRQQNTLLMEQNKQLSVALFANNPDAQRAYSAMAAQQRAAQQQQATFNPLPTEINP